MHVVAATCFAIKVFGRAINGVVASLGRWDNWFAPTWALILYHSCCKLSWTNRCTIQNWATFSSKCFVTMECETSYWLNNHWWAASCFGRWHRYFLGRNVALTRFCPIRYVILCKISPWGILTRLCNGQKLLAVRLSQAAWFGLGWADKICGISLNCTSLVIASSSPNILFHLCRNLY